MDVTQLLHQCHLSMTWSYTCIIHSITQIVHGYHLGNIRWVSSKHYTWVAPRHYTWVSLKHYTWVLLGHYTWVSLRHYTWVSPRHHTWVAPREKIDIFQDLGHISPN